VLESGKVDDKLYGIPGGITSFSYAIRADILEEYGIEVPDMETWTWDEMIDTAAQVTEASGGDVYGVDIPMGEISNLGIWLRQHGEDLWDADGKPAFTAATVQEWFEMYLHAVEVGAQPAPDALDAIGAAADQSSLGQGFIAIGSIPTNSYAVFNDVAGGGLELGYYPGESEADQRGQQVIPALYWSIAASSGDASDAAKVLDFIVNDPEGAALLGSTHGQPANADVATSMADTQSEDDKIAFDEIIKLSELDLTAPVPDPAGSAELREELSGIGDQVKFGQITPEDGAQAFVDAAASILGE
jgi:multiple sugar transport system substrate-binding protein